jgi:hydrogenase/urease accessory protein HupE
LLALASICIGLGGIVGCIAGGLITQYSHPKYSFVTFSICGIILSFVAFNMPVSCE